MKKKIILIVGPTASGKTFASVEIAKYINSEIISADSMQIYKHMDIGTAKVTEEEKQGIVHHMIDIVDPDVSYTVSEFKNDAEKIIDKLHSEDKIPVMAGGTGLYVNSIIYDLDFSSTISDPAIRRELEDLLEEKGKEYLHGILESVDPVSAGKIHCNNVKRVVRALEVYRITGIPFSEQNTDFRKNSEQYDFIIIGLNMDREILYKRINERVEEMIEAGLVKEVESLMKKGYNRDLQSMQGIGYKEVTAFLDGEIPLEESVRLIKRNSRRLAKRQFTWFRPDKRIKWIEVDPENKIKLIEDIKIYLNERGLQNETSY
ncbi:tRNA dimethylallyltransferase [Dethiosulfatibacter aminovorans DSM 17477]|uniref:tRNA dimethylallyltransferase n=1 Tax=Dethiosulfatibacter aminovorans DSM 17477 TaxID=1121476 RepID=A0A1M6DBQ6_9FIRM|nr:tRNA (adenosine(37)-N6)-dimethylallyltransferase MiaA [Dethiosulfatibacter aminovorans]SHI70662.1 tRNA dimethylallyltransferase [Dethiosulfatibacter aminovorans DSM 17477]